MDCKVPNDVDKYVFFLPAVSRSLVFPGSRDSSRVLFYNRPVHLADYATLEWQFNGA